MACHWRTPIIAGHGLMPTSGTPQATTLNDENIVVIGDLEETYPAAKADQRQLAEFARAEIDRIIADLAQPI
jgi:hypothetical protein